MNTANLTFGEGVMVGAGGVIIFLFLLLFLRPWIRSILCGAPVSLATIVGMCLRGNTPMFLIDVYLSLQKSGLQIPIHAVEACYVANKGKIRNIQSLVNLVPEYHKNMEKMIKDKSSK
jgi:uncharacterized protein YqfA (UPF0365 family)